LDKMPGAILLDRVDLVDFVFAEPVGRQPGGPEREPKTRAIARAKARARACETARPPVFAIGHAVRSGAGPGKTVDSTPVTGGKAGARSSPLALRRCYRTAVQRVIAGNRLRRCDGAVHAGCAAHAQYAHEYAPARVDTR